MTLATNDFWLPIVLASNLATEEYMMKTEVLKVQTSCEHFGWPTSARPDSHSEA